MKILSFLTVLVFSSFRGNAAVVVYYEAGHEYALTNFIVPRRGTEMTFAGPYMPPNQSYFAPALKAFATLDIDWENGGETSSIYFNFYQLINGGADSRVVVQFENGRGCQCLSGLV